MQGLILNKEQEFYSLFSTLFDKIKEFALDYNWLISNAECYPQKIKYNEKLNQRYCWLSGMELASILVDEDFQWVWGVLSGFDKMFLADEVLKYPLPYTDGYEGFWKNPINLQHPLAEVEIVAFDSKCTLFISKKNIIIQKIASFYPQLIDLEKYNIYNCQ